MLMAGVVIDCSITMSWCFPDENDPYAREVLRSLPSLPALVPAHWSLEVANSLVVGERCRRLDEASVLTFVALLASLPITLDQETPERALRETLSLARERNLSSYDAAYLELATRRGLPLATLDQRLRNAAAAVGVDFYVVP
jgi:predicted nucleic acid-binding protein